jgi:hypothetical protein
MLTYPGIRQNFSSVKSLRGFLSVDIFVHFLAHGFNVFNPFIANGIGQGAKQIVAILYPLAEDTLSTFSEIADNAISKLSSESRMGTDSFASGNTLTGNRAFQNLASIQNIRR